jgi:hypothetical protein
MPSAAGSCEKCDQSALQKIVVVVEKFQIIASSDRSSSITSEA